jgi:hypothetical protein
MMNDNFTCKVIHYGIGTNIYEVNNIEGMTKQEIIDACDPNNFGGQVCGKIVKVYAD